MCPLVPDVRPAAARLELPYMLYLPGIHTADLLFVTFAVCAIIVLHWVQIRHPMQMCTMVI
jgi:hypothetical protein